MPIQHVEDISTRHKRIDTMSTTQVATGPRHPNVARKEHEALMRLIKIAKTDTGQARRVADFLLAWWNPTANGRFDFIDLWSVDRQIEEDILLLLTMAVRLQEYPDTLGYSNEFECLVSDWRKPKADGGSD
jgi:hypothetical protein